MQMNADTTPCWSTQLRVPKAIRILTVVGLVVSTAAGCGGESSPRRKHDNSGHEELAAGAERHGETAHDGRGDQGEEIRIAPDVQERFGIVTALAGTGPVEVIRDLPGEIVSDPDRMVHVKPPFAGTIQRVFKHLGDRVAAGDKLAVIESAQALAPYTVKAGIAGVITAEHAAVGEAVDVGHELFTIADPTVVWVQLQVFPGDLGRVRVGDLVEVLTPDATSGARGEISFVAPVLDHATRTATARVVLENDGTYRPGLFVTGRVAVEREEVAVSIPTSALVRQERGWIVFVRAGPDVFELRSVTVSRRGIERSAVETGLDVGEAVVVDGAFLVKSAAARSEMGGGHGH